MSRPARRSRESTATAAFVALALGALGGGGLACVLGEERAPGCSVDADCEDGVCRAGACFRTTTDRSEPNDPADAGDAGADADPDADTEGDGSA